MQDETATTTTPAADAPAVDQIAEGVMPPNAASSANERMSVEDARAALRGLRPAPPRESDPLLDEDGGRDPLTDEGVTIEEVLGIGAAEMPPGEEQAETEVEPPAVEAEAAITEEPAAEIKTEADGRKRVNIFRKNADGSFVNSEITRRALVMADEEGIDVADALKALGASPQTSEPAAEAVKPVGEQVKSSAEINAEIEALEKAETEAAEAFDDAAEKEAGRKIRRLLSQLPAAMQRDLQQQQSAQQSQGALAAQVNESVARAASAYPSAVEEGSKLNLALTAETTRLQKANSPILTDADWPETLAAKVATRLGIAPKLAAQSAPAKPAPVPAVVKPPVAPLKRAVPALAPGSVSGVTPKPDPRAELDKQIAASRDPAELKLLMRKAVALERAA